MTERNLTRDTLGTPTPSLIGLDPSLRWFPWVTSQIDMFELSNHTFPVWVSHVL